MVQRPAGTNAFEFVVVSGLRAAQLMRGSIPRVEIAHKVITTAQLEVGRSGHGCDEIAASTVLADASSK